MAAAANCKEALQARYVGQSLYNTPTPALVLDLAKVEANCNLMLDAAQRLKLQWRAHIKTHKTIELTRLQVGDKSNTPVKLIVSTVAEAESILPLLQEYRESGREVNVLFSFPIYSSCVDRLAQISAQLGPDGLSVLVDHREQLKHLTALASKSGNPPLVFLKVNVGADRAGVSPDSPDCLHLVDQLLVSEAVGSCRFLGVYAHTSQSYETRGDWEALDYLGTEIGGLHRVAQAIRRERPTHPLVLSVGASPQVTSLQHPAFTEPRVPGVSRIPGNPRSDALISKLSAMISTLQQEDLTLELHAGVYSTLDIQQLASHARSSDYLNANALALTVLVEVVSLYPQRNRNNKTTEALVNGGTLALAREPCKDMGSPPGRHYSAWGLVSPWNCCGQPVPGPEFPAQHGGWQVGRVTQEHGILAWVGTAEEEARLYIGQRLRVWPNHACITAAMHNWFLIVDSRNAGREDEIVDVWPRWNGW